ncbi:cytochrome c oxidase assembly protein [Kineococcus sp. GCM10028916]
MIPGWVLLFAAGVLLASYLVAEGGLHRRGDRWPVPRTGAAVAAAVAWAVAGLWPVRGAVDDVVVHLLVTMAAPVLLALSAPVSLALRTVPPRLRGLLVLGLHLRWSRVVTWLPVATALEVGGLYLYYLVPVPPAVHGLLMVHMVAAGWLFATALVGPDPVPHRPSLGGKAVALLTVFAAHDVLAKLLYARGGGAAAELLFYGGDVVELLTAVALFGRWYRRSRPRPVGRPVRPGAVRDRAAR